MSWFFGKKKHHRESPPESPGEPAQPDDFIFIERRGQPANPDSDNNTPGLYPSLNNVTPYPSLPTPIVKQTSLEGQCSDLSCIPFKLCRELERNENDDLVIDQLRLNEIMSFLERIKVENYDYQFSLERSVIAELDSQSATEE